jgi:hypothetical protein
MKNISRMEYDIFSVRFGNVMLGNVVKPPVKFCGLIISMDEDARDTKGRLFP